MPGILTKTAKCPQCGDPLIALCDLSTTASVEREYFHEKVGGQARKKTCTRIFTDLDEAWRERRDLERHA